MSEDNGGFLPHPKNIPKSYLKLSYPVHSNDINVLFMSYSTLEEALK